MKFKFTFVPNEECKDFHNNMANLNRLVNDRIKKIKDANEHIAIYLEKIKNINNHNQQTNHDQKISTKYIFERIETISSRSLGDERCSATLAVVPLINIKIMVNHAQISWKDLFNSPEYLTRNFAIWNMFGWCTCGKIPDEVIVYILLDDIKSFNIDHYKDYLGITFICTMCCRENQHSISINL